MNVKLHSAPVNHTFYGGAQLFQVNTLEKCAQKSLAFFRQVFPSVLELSQFLAEDDFTSEQMKLIFSRLEKKLNTSAIEDFRIDFEDGLGLRSGAEEDFFAQKAGEIVCDVRQNFSGRIGLRLKSPERATLQRCKRTFKIFFDAFFKQGNNLKPDGFFIVTLPKVKNSKSIQHFVNFVRQYCRKKKISSAFFKYEIMVETAEIARSIHRIAPLSKITDYLGTRLLGLHIGIYDYLSELGVPPSAQGQNHFFIQQLEYFLVSNFSHLEISDGVNQSIPNSGNLMEAMKILKCQYRLNLEKMDRGINRGWDIHPFQLVARYLALICFFEKNTANMQQRYENFTNSNQKAQKLGVIFDDAASMRGVESFLEREKLFLGVTENDSPLV